MVTYGLILANIFVYLITSLEKGFLETADRWIDALAYIPSLLKYSHHWYRIITCTFVHADIFHIFFNMYFLYVFGRGVELRLGRGRYLLLYMLSGLLATCFHTAFTPLTGSVGLVIPTVGASGAISGVLGAHMLMFPTERLTAWFFIPFPIRVVTSSAYFLLFWFATQVLYGYGRFESGVAFFAHAGGFIGGIIGTWLLLKRMRLPLHARGLGKLAKGILTCLMLLLFFGAYACYKEAPSLTGVYVFNIETLQGQERSQDQAVYTTYENEALPPARSGPRVVFNRLNWAGLLVNGPGYACDCRENTYVSPPGMPQLQLKLELSGYLSYDHAGILSFFRGSMTTDVLLTDRLGRVVGVEPGVRYDVSLKSEEVAGDLGERALRPLSLVCLLSLALATWVVLARSHQLAFPPMGYRLIVPA